MNDGSPVQPELQVCCAALFFCATAAVPSQFQDHCSVDCGAITIPPDIENKVVSCVEIGHDSVLFVELEVFARHGGEVVVVGLFVLRT